MFSMSKNSEGDTLREKAVGRWAQLKNWLRETWVGGAWSKWIGWGDASADPSEAGVTPRNILGFFQDFLGWVVSLPFAIAIKVLDLAYLACTNTTQFGHELSYQWGRIWIGFAALFGANVVYLNRRMAIGKDKWLEYKMPDVDWTGLMGLLYAFCFSSIFGSIFIEAGLPLVALVLILAPFFVVAIKNFNKARIALSQWTRRRHETQKVAEETRAHLLARQQENSETRNLSEFSDALIHVKHESLSLSSDDARADALDALNYDPNSDDALVVDNN